MIIECPSCAVKFNLPDTALHAGPRKMKCSKCAFVWTARPPKAEAAAPISKIAGATSLPAAPVRTQWTSLEYAVASISGIFAVFAIVLGMVSFMPQTLGFHPSTELGFSALAIQSEHAQGSDRFQATESFVIHGTIANNSTAPQHVPTLCIKALNKHGSAVYTRTLKGGDKIIPAGETYDFNVEGLKRPDPEITRFMVQMGGGLELMLRSSLSEPDA